MPKKPIIIGVTGGSGGGKTSVSRAILSNFPDEKIAMIEHDSYYKDQSHLTFEERVSTNYDHPFAFDTANTLVVKRLIVRNHRTSSLLKEFWYLRINACVI